jgi:hypothetical protein
MINTTASFLGVNKKDGMKSLKILKGASQKAYKGTDNIMVKS